MTEYLAESALATFTIVFFLFLLMVATTESGLFIFLCL